jgi:nitrate reductase gamma subunit
MSGALARSAASSSTRPFRGALGALIILDVGFYRRIVVATQRTWARYGHHLSRADAEPAAARRSFLDEVLLHRTLYKQSPLRWLRHTLILWGFGLMLLTEFSAVIFREVVREWGWPEAWQADHPLRLLHDLAFDLTGLMVLAGCLIALWWRFQVRGRPEVRYSDTPTVIFLLVVVVGGFWAEALRISGELPARHAAWSFVGYALAKAFMAPGPVSEGATRALWIVHAVSSLAFIAYVPVKRLIHSCATPMGRIMNSQERLLRAKKTAVAAGLLKGSGG